MINHTVFVYGTLKSGYGNNTLLYGSEFMGKAQTVDRYPMVVDALPFVLEDKGEGHRISGEVYVVDDDHLKRLDQLEGHPIAYRRRQVPVEMQDGGTEVTAWLYFYPHADTRMRSLPYNETYEKGMIWHRYM